MLRRRVPILNDKQLQGDIDAVDTKADGANSQEQRIYYRSNSTTAPTAPSTWVTSTSTANATWSTKRMQYDSTYKYLYTCIQRKTVGGTITNSTVLLDDTTTVIDGGNIITGTVTANQIASNAITADKIAANAITIGNMDSTAKSNIQSGVDAKAQLDVKDTRNDNQTPIWYINNYANKQREVREFKYTNKIGLNSTAAYCYLTTHIPWMDSSGGYPKQTVEYNGRQYWRHGTSDTAWSSWIDAYGTAVNSAKTATTYITAIDNNGIRVHPSSTQNNSAVINANGMEVFKGGTDSAHSVAFYGDTARIGKASASNIVIDPNDGIAIKNGSTELSSFTADGVQLGENNPYAEIGFNKRRGVLYGKNYADIQYGLELGIPDNDPNDRWADNFSELTTRLFAHKIPDDTKESTSALYLDAQNDGARFSLFSYNNRYDSSGDELPTVSSQIIGYVEQNSKVGHTSVGNMAMTGRAVETHGMAVDTQISSDGTYATTDVNFDANRIKFNGTVIHSSDRRLKEHIDNLGVDAEKFIRSLKPVRFTLKGEESTGFYAQDVESVDPWGCFVSEDKDGYKTLNYIGLIAPLVAYCQRLEERIAELEKK